jgi:hypothetical protein
MHYCSVLFCWEAFLAVFRPFWGSDLDLFLGLSRLHSDRHEKSREEVRRKLTTAGRGVERRQ